VSDAAFARAFERGEVANADLNHVAHLRLALAYLEESTSVDEAAGRMASALRRFATAAGHPEKYHHTITVFWMHMVARLLDKDLPLSYYSRERLWSDAARAGWLAPDLTKPGGFAPPDPPSPSLAGAPRPRSAPARRARGAPCPLCGSPRPITRFSLRVT
jgi:hypothetical protein